ncbi:hypothetical protein AKJ09_09867 [Labilithrix luteola]|uniref:Uncharacterized protein n=1 Tax=Labilithrix luteola TaxID=1391654 RepID=A0A0K1QBU4_9BACT|nr:hypothetical protein [Labilithrix luteola]AKV03204.1 hypothetical protein AKJ09_09867 [Labilithrix luteola]
MSGIRQFILDHGLTVVLVSVLGALFTALFHPRSREEFSRYPVRIGALFKLLAAFTVDSPKAANALMGVVFASAPAERAKAMSALVAAVTWDLPKGLEAIGQLITGREVPPGAEPVSSPPVLALAFALLLPTLSACAALRSSAETPRETARAVVVTLAKAVQVADVTCATIAETKKDAGLASKCADAYDVARPALLGAESAVDAWESGGAGNVPCAVARSVSALVSISHAVTAAGGTVPPVVDDALRLAPALTVACHG